MAIRKMGRIRGFAGFLLLMAVTVAVFGCGGGGGGSEPVVGQTVTAAYYPNAAGDTWAYWGTSSEVSGPYFDTVSVTGTKFLLGVNASVFLSDNQGGDGVPIEDYYFKDSRAFTYYGNNDADDWLSPALSPYDEAVFDVPLVNLPLFSATSVPVNIDLDSDGKNETVNASGVLNFEKFETVETAAGTFTAAGKGAATINTTVFLSDGGFLPSVATVTQWRVPGFGLVKETSTASLGAVTITETLDIQGLRVNGVAAGYFAPKALASDIATANSDNQNPGQHAVGTDGTNFLLVHRQQTNIPNTPATYKWAARRVLGDGTVEAPFDLGSPDTNTCAEAAVGFDGTNYLVLTNTNCGTSGYSGIGAQRVTTPAPPSLPSLVDATPISVAADGFQPSVAYGGGTYLVVYSKPAARSNVYGVLVSPSGSVGTEFNIYTGSGTDVQDNPSVAFDGTNFLVVWEHRDSDAAWDTANIYATRVASDGTILSSPVFVSTAAEAQNDPQVACDGTNCLVVWTDRRNYPGQPYNVVPGPGDIYGTRINNLDALLDGLPDTGGLAIATGITANAGYPGLAYNGTDYIAAWSRGAFINNPGGPTGIFAAHVSTAGNVTLGPADTGVSISGPPAPATRLYFVSMAGGANGTLAAWLNNIETSGTTKSISGALMYPLISN